MKSLRRMVALVLCLLVAPAAAGLVTEDFRIPAPGAEPDGLEAVLVKPPGPGRYPLVIVSHGAMREPGQRAAMKIRRIVPQLSEFARRGFVAVGALRRGYGSSPGGWAESYGPCEHPDYLTAGRAGVSDLKAMIAALSRRDDVDASRIIAVGISAGGFATVALTADPPPGLVAGISFAGGRGAHGPDGGVCHDEELVAAFRSFGQRSRLPMLWVYAANDSYFDLPLARRLRAAFAAGGGRVELVEAQPFGTEGHLLFSTAGRPVWTPIVDAFLTRHALMPHAPPTTSPTLDAPAQLSAKGRADFRTFLDSATHKAFAVSPAGAYAWRTGLVSVKEATEAALERCQTEGHRPCHLYAVDDAYAPDR